MENDIKHNVMLISFVFDSFYIKKKKDGSTKLDEHQAQIKKTSEKIEKSIRDDYADAFFKTLFNDFKKIDKDFQSFKKNPKIDYYRNLIKTGFIVKTIETELKKIVNMDNSMEIYSEVHFNEIRNSLETRSQKNESGFYSNVEYILLNMSYEIRSYLLVDKGKETEHSYYLYSGDLHFSFTKDLEK